MPQGICKNCNRLIYDTEKLDELPNELECQHCGMVNIIRIQPEPEVEPIEPVVIPVQPIVKKVTPIKRKRR